MIPVGDSVPTRRVPSVNYALIILTVFAFLFELALGPTLDQFVRHWGVTPAAVSRALAGDPRVSQGVLWTLVTALFLHGGWLHLGGNMLFLWVFGDNVEERFGHWRYLLFYLAAGAGANLVQVLALPSTRVPLIGASGAIAAVLGAYLVMYPRSRVTVLIPVFFFPLLLPLPAFVMLGVWFVTQLANGVASITQHAQLAGGVGWWAHVGGFALGVALTPLLPKARGREEVYRPLTVEPPRALRRASPLGAAVVRSVTLAGDVINALLTLRILFRFLGLEAEGLLGLFVRLVYSLSWPLVEPFTDFAPYLVLGGRVVEVFTVLAFLVYYLLIAILAWALALVLVHRHPIT